MHAYDPKCRHQEYPKGSRERLAAYLECDCVRCRVAMSNDAPVHLFARLLLIAPTGKVGAQ